MTDTDSDLRALAEKATPGPWSLGRSTASDGDNDWHPQIWPAIGAPIASSDGRASGRPGAPEKDAADFAYIVAACNALPALLDRLDKAEAALSVERIAQALRVHRPLDNGTCSCRKWTFGKESLTEIFTEHQAKGVRAALTSTDKETQG
jgi:hypothetical protein